MKRFGIYLAYPPTVDLRGEGLGRHLAQFLKAAQDRGDVRFVVACPSWMQETLTQLCEDEEVRLDSFDVIAPSSRPLLLRTYELYRRLRKRRGHGRFMRIARRAIAWVKKGAARINELAEIEIVSARSFIYAFLLLVLAIVLSPLILVAFLVGLAWRTGKVVERGLYALARRTPLMRRIAERAHGIGQAPKDNPVVVRLYRRMEEAESELMRELIEARTDVAAWYSPTAFWPQFNRIDAPRLMCVPDVVLADFPVGFATADGDRLLESFRLVERAIKQGEHFVTYSDDVKWRTLADRYLVDPSRVHVIPHGAFRLDELIAVKGFTDDAAATNSLCRNLFRSALAKAVESPCAGMFGGGDVRYVFYASQFRPNKNVLNLLRAYEDLLRRRHVGHKLILTGNPRFSAEIAEFIASKRLQNDVLCLHGLTAQELAACYRLADLAVNPSLSEGGFPFTFSEAVSVGTPLVMARIPVTTDVISDPALAADMLFDPYDWRDMSARIASALSMKADLYRRQRELFDTRIATRTWSHVVDDYLRVLDRISEPRSKASTA